MALSNQATINLAVNVQNMAGLRSLTTGLMALKNQVIALQRNPTMRSANGAVGTPAQQVRQAAAVQAAQTQGLAKITAAQAALTTQAGRLAAAQARLAKVSGQAATAMRRQRDEAKSLTDRIKTAEENVDALWRAAFRLQMLGGDFTRWGQAIFGALKGLTDQFGTFEFMANRAAGALQVFNTDADSVALSTTDLQNSIMDTAQELRLFPAEEVAKSVYFWGSTTGVVVETQEELNNVMSALTPVMKAAALTQTDYETAIKGVYGIMTQFNPEVIETANATKDYAEMASLAEEVTTRLFYAAQVTSLEFSDLVESFKMVGPVAAGVGADLEDMVGLIGRLADLGIRGSMAGRSFRQMFMRMASPPGPARKAIEGLFAALDPSVFGGKTYMELIFPEGQFESTANFFKVITRAVRDLNDVERMNFLTKFSTANLLPTMIALIGQEERAQAGLGGVVDKTAVSLDRQREVFEQSWRLLTGSWKGAVEGASRSIENLQLVIGRALAEAFRPFVDQITEFFMAARVWAGENEDLIQQIGKWAGALGAVLLGLGALFTAIGSAIGIVAGLRLAFEAFGGVILRWTGYGIIIGGFIDAIIRNFTEVQERLQEAQASIQRAIDNVIGYFGDGEDQVGDFMDTFRDLMDTIVEHTTNAIVFVAHFIEEVSKIKPLFDLIKNVGIPVLTNFIGIMLGARILAAAAGMLKITAAVTALTVAMSNMGRARAVQNLQAITGGLRIVSDNGISSGITRNDVAIRKMGLSVGGLATSFKTFAMANPLLVIAGVAAFGFAAYENNWLNFRTIVDSITNSFRDLTKEGQAVKDAISDIALAENIEGYFQNASGGMDDFVTTMGEYQSEFKALQDNWVNNWPNVAPMDFESPRVMAENAQQAFRDLGQYLSAAGAGANSAEEAFANLGAELSAANIDVADWSKALVYADNALGLTTLDAQKFASALVETTADGVTSLDELRKNYEALGGSAAHITALSEAQLIHLGVTTRAAEETQALMLAEQARGEALIEQLAAFPTTASELSEQQFIDIGAIMLELNKVALKVGPEFREVIDRAIAPYAALGGEDVIAAFGDAMVSSDPTQYLNDYFATLGAVSVPADLFADVSEDLQAAINEAMSLTPGADINIDSLLQKIFSDLKIEVIEDWLYPKISAIGDGVASAIAGVFRPGKFKEKLKGITSDKKGWATFWKSVTDPIFQSALSGERGSEAQALADEWAQGLFSDFETAFPAAAGPARDKLTTQLKGFFNADSMPGMSESLQRFGTNLLVTMYDTLDQPMPQWLREYFVGFGGEIPGLIRGGAEGEQVTINYPLVATPPGGSPLMTGGGTTAEFYNNYISHNMPTPTLQFPRVTGTPLMEGGGSTADFYNNYVNHMPTPTVEFPRVAAPQSVLMEGGGSTAEFFNNYINHTLPQAMPATIPSPPMAASDTVAATTARNTFITQTETAVAGMNMQVPAFVAPSTTAASGVINTFISTTRTKLTGMASDAFWWGNHLSAKYASGIKSREGSVRQAAIDVANAARRVLHFSRPDEGPLRDLYKWGHHLVEIYARAMKSSSPKVREAARRIAQNVADEFERLDKRHKKTVDRTRNNNKKLAKDLDDTAKKVITSVKGAQNFRNYDDYLDYLGKVHNRIQKTRDKVRRDRDDTVRDLTVSKNDKDSKITYESRHKKVIEIRLIASSPDGTVDRVELKALRKGVMDGLALADLEHIVNIT